MHAYSHREISRRVALKIDGKIDWQYLLSASEMPDWLPSKFGHHFKKELHIEDILDCIKESRYYFLEEGCSGVNFQRLLGVAFHHIQDRMIQSEDRSLHNRYEAAISRAISSFVESAEFDKIERDDNSLLEYLKNKVIFTDIPEEIINNSFRVCLSVAKLATSSPIPFTLGNNVKKLHENIKRSIESLKTKINEFRSEFNIIKQKTDKINNLLNNRRAGKNPFIWISCLWLNYKKHKLIKELKNYYKDIDHLIEKYKGNIYNDRKKLAEYLKSGYDKEYTKMFDNKLWNGIKKDSYIEPGVIYDFFNSIDTNISLILQDFKTIQLLF